MIREIYIKSHKTKTNKSRHREAASGRGDLSAMWQIASRLLLRSPEKRAAHHNDGGGKAVPL